MLLGCFYIVVYLKCGGKKFITIKLSKLTIKQAILSAIKKAKLTLTASSLHQVVVELQSSIPGGRRGRQPGTADEAWHRRRRAGGGGDRR